MRRVITRCCLGNPTPPPRERELLVLAKELLPAGRGWLWNQALIELGALVCSARSPACPQCPLNPICQTVQAPISADITYQTDQPSRAKPKVAEQKTVYRAPYKGSSRYYRGRIIAFLRDIPDESFATRAQVKMAVAESEQHTDAWLDHLLDGLVRDGLIEQDGEHVRLPRM
jgi:A/G-specific adenine glycosylase